MDFNIMDYGAISRSDKLNTKAIQSAIDACAASGGGKVIVSDGVYMTGTVILKSNVNFHIEESAVLLGSPDCADYPERKDVKHVDSNCLPRERNACLIFAEECENISITGMGKIDCNGLSFVKEKENYKGGWRFERIDAPTPPRVVFFTGCKNVSIKDITMVNQPAGWSYWIHDCDFVTCDRLKIYADVQYPNNDGIHINSSRNVTISNCSIVCGDDGRRYYTFDCTVSDAYDIFDQYATVVYGAFSDRGYTNIPVPEDHKTSYNYVDWIRVWQKDEEGYGIKIK